MTRQLKLEQNPLPHTLLFEHPTLAQLVTFIKVFRFNALKTIMLINFQAHISREKVWKSQQRFTHREHEDGDLHQIAIVGIGCRFPKASSVEDFWNLMLHRTISQIDTNSFAFDTSNRF